MSYTLEDLKDSKTDSDTAYQSDVNAALETARKASDAAESAWDDYNSALDIPNRETWDAACHDYNIAAAAADAAWENARNVINGK